MTKTTKILREEYFGGVLYDRNKVSYRFLGKEETEQLRASKEAELREARYQDAPRQVLSAPIRIYWEITRRCDKRCPQCFTASGKPVEDELSLEDSLRVVDGLRKDNVLEIRITGGEPTTKNGWEKIIRHALDCGIAVTLNTHGSYDDSLREKIAALKTDQVIVSLDGPQEVHDSSRGRGSFYRVMGTIKYFYEKKVPVRVNTLLTKDVLPYLETVTELVRDYVGELCFMQLKPIGRGGKLLDSMPTFQEVYEVDKRINILRSKHPHLRISTSYDIISEGLVMPAPDLDLTTCAAGMRGCNIDSRGDIYACGFLEELGSKFKLGNIKAAGFSVLRTWYDSGELKRFRTQNLEKARKCRSCSYLRNPCFGSCIVMESYASTKSPHRIDPYCYEYEL
jgi:radical SAM protein with 4Fe4S-binding SPASM domain